MNHLDRELWVQALRDVHARASDAALNHGRVAAMRRLDRRTEYVFRNRSEYHTTFPASRETYARMADLADVAGIYLSQMAVLAMLFGILTLDNNRGYRDAFELEVDDFREYALHRTEELRLPDESADEKRHTPGDDKRLDRRRLGEMKTHDARTDQDT